MIYCIVAVALLCAGGTYLNVAAMKGQPGGQLLRLLPIVGYLFLSLSVLYMPGLVLWSVLALLLLLLLDKTMTGADIYNAARRAIPPTTAELIGRLRYAPFVLIGLVLLYVGTTYHYQKKAPKQATVVVSDTLTLPEPSAQAKSDEALYDSLKNNRP